jgi:hypothetical protein
MGGREGRVSNHVTLITSCDDFVSPPQHKLYATGGGIEMDTNTVVSMGVGTIVRYNRAGIFGGGVHVHGERRMRQDKGQEALFSSLLIYELIN